MPDARVIDQAEADRLIRERVNPEAEDRADIPEGADLRRAALTGAQLQGADLSHANCSGCDLRGADLTGASVYGVSAWDVALDDAVQRGLVIAPPDQSAITVDDLEVAQFVYLMYQNPKIRRVIDTITSRAVLILGRFTPERKVILDAIREKLRRRDWVPIGCSICSSTTRSRTCALASSRRFSFRPSISMQN